MKRTPRTPRRSGGKNIAAALKGTYITVGERGRNKVILEDGTYRWGNGTGKFVATKIDDYTYRLDMSCDQYGGKDSYFMTRQKSTFMLKRIPDKQIAWDDEHRFRRAEGPEGVPIADSASKAVASPAKVRKPRPVSDFVDFILDWGHPEWVIVAVEAPVEKVSVAYASLRSAKRTWPAVPVRKSTKKDQMALEVAVVQPKDSKWSVIYEVMCYPIDLPDIRPAAEAARTLSERLRTRALYFVGEDTSGAMGYELFRNGKKAGRVDWESQNDPADDAFTKLGLWLPACYVRKDGRTTTLAAMEPWANHIERADVVARG